MSDHEQTLTEVLKKIATERAIDDTQVKIQPITSGGANFTTHLFQATIGNGYDELKLFAKVAAVGEKLREHVPVLLFDMENLFYTRLYKVYESMQEKHNVPQEKRFVAPKCYGCSDKLYEEVIVLEDLSAQGFTVYDRLKSVKWNYAAKAVEQIARFHALSIAFEKEHKDEFNKILERFNILWPFEDIVKESFKKAINVVNEEYKDRLKRFFESSYARDFNELYKPLKLNVLAHVDNRVSNHMYRRDTSGCMQVRIVDYQTIRGASPVVDLLYFIFTGTDENFRKLYYDQLLDHYYNELSLAIKRLDLNPDEIYTRTDFDFEYKTKLPFGLSIAVLMLPVVTIDADNAPKMNEDMDMSDFSVLNTSDLFSERLNGVISDYIRWGVL